jgi:hypothetical protein
LERELRKTNDTARSAKVRAIILQEAVEILQHNINLPDSEAKKLRDVLAQL